MGEVAPDTGVALAVAVVLYIAVLGTVAVGIAIASIVVVGIAVAGIVGVELAGSTHSAVVGYFWLGSRSYLQVCMAIV